MRSVLPAFYTLSLLASLSVLAGAQNLPAPEVKAARHFQFTPQPGTAWMIEATLDGKTWHDVAGPFFANGKAADHFCPAAMEREFRLRYIDPASVGLAPVSVAGQTLVIEHQGKAREIIFLNATTGILRLDDAHARNFTTAWTKTAPDKAEAILTGTDGSFTLLRVEFMAAGMGRWGMEDIPSVESAPLVKETIDSGSFATVEGRVPRGPENIQVPSDLSQRRMVLNEAGQISILEFTGAETVSLRRGSAVAQLGTFSYDPETTHSGLLALNLQGIPSEGFRLEMLTPNTGTITSTAGGNSRAPLRSGTFTLPNQPAAPANPNCPPTGISGLSYIFADSAPCTLSFYPNGEGVQVKEIGGITRVTHFRYLYSRTGGDKASVAVTFPGVTGDLVDDYELDFSDDCDGDFKRTSYAGGNAVDRRNSTFTPAPNANR